MTRPTQPTNDRSFSARDSFNTPNTFAVGLDKVLTYVVDAGLAGVILVAPWFMGGRHPLGELVLVVLASIVAIAWIAKQWMSHRGGGWRRSAGDCLLLAAVLLVLLQMIPWPQVVFELLSPHSRVVLPLWGSGGQSPVALGTWNTVTLTPDATRGSLAMLLSYGMLFLVAVQRIERIQDVERILRLLALSATVLAVVGVAQYLVGNGKFLWIYQHPFRDTYDAVKGPFINKNHFAHLLALGLAPMVWALQQALQQRNRATGESFAGGSGSSTSQMAPTCILLGLGVVLFAGSMTLSRGGIVAMAIALLFCTAAMYRGGFVSRRLATCMVGVCLLSGALLAIHGYQQVATRLSDLTAGSIQQLDHNAARRDLWKADALAVADFWRFGAGLGSHREVYPIYFQGSWENELTHAENGYLQVALEAGVPGLVLLLSGLIYCCWACAQGLQTRAASPRVYLAAATVSAALAVSVLHSLCDFVWYIPSLMAVTTLLVACACRLPQLAVSERESRQPEPSDRASRDSSRSSATWPLPRMLWACAGAAVVLCCTWMLYDRGCAALAAPHWDQYLTYSLSPESKTEVAVPEPIVAHLQQVLRWTPDDARAHIRMADVCLRRFGQMQAQGENSMSISDISDAAMQSRAQFASRADLDRWLTRAVGENRHYLDEALYHAHRGLALGPLQGGGYTHLAQLCFLEGAQSTARQAYVEQALRVRPNDGKVLMVAGSEALRNGEFAAGLDYWRRSFHSGGDSQAALIDSLLAQRVPVEYLVKQFRPDLAAVRVIDAKYSAVFGPQPMRALLAHYGQLGEAAATEADDATATRIWMELRGVYRRLADDAKELDCLRRAADLNPNEFAVRYQLAECLFAQGYFAEAQRHFVWCQQRQPEDANLSARVAQSAKEGVRQASLHTDLSHSKQR